MRSRTAGGVKLHLIDSESRTLSIVPRPEFNVDLEGTAQASPYGLDITSIVSIERTVYSNLAAQVSIDMDAEDAMLRLVDGAVQFPDRFNSRVALAYDVGATPTAGEFELTMNGSSFAHE